MKTCFRCLQSKPIDEFYKHPRMSDGRLGKCKDCTRSDVISNRLKRLEQYREYDRERANNARRVAQRKAYAKTPEYKAAKRASGDAWARRNRHKKSAHSAVHNALREGKLQKKPCEVCGTESGVEAHHDDYSKPLDVRWLCNTHHTEHHKALRAQQRSAKKQAA